jgi:hypothetical protein
LYINLLFIRSKSSCVLDDFQWEYKDVFLVDFCRSTLDVFLVDFYLTLKVNVIHLQIKIQRFSISEKTMFAEYYAHNKVYIDHCVSLISI